MQRRWKGDDFGEAGNRLNADVALAPPGDERLTSRASRSRFFAVPVIRGGGVLVWRTLPGRSRLERSLFSLSSRCGIDARDIDAHLRSGLRQSRWLFPQSKFRWGVGIRFSPALELAGCGEVHLFINLGCSRPGS